MIAAMEKLCDPEVRKSAGVIAQNKYVFPSTQSSNNHVSGWHVINNICAKLVLENRRLLTATKNRHRVSTWYAALELPQKERQFFYDHMGHSEQTNQSIYQAPPAIMEIVKVGKHLMNIDTGE